MRGLSTVLACAALTGPLVALPASATPHPEPARGPALSLLALPAIPPTNASFLTSIGSTRSFGTNMVDLRSDGRAVLWVSPVPGNSHAVVRTLRTGGTQVVSTAVDGTPENGYTQSARYLAPLNRIMLVSQSTNLTPSSTNGQFQVYVKDTGTGAIDLVSLAAVLDGPNTSVDEFFLSANRRFAIFSTSYAGYPVPTSFRARTFAYDSVTGSTREITVRTAAGARVAGCTSTSVDNVGRLIAAQCGQRAYVVDTSRGSRIVDTIGRAGSPVLAPLGGKVVYTASSRAGVGGTFVLNRSTRARKPVPDCGGFVAVSPNFKYVGCSYTDSRTYTQDTVVNIATGKRWYIGTKNGRLGRENLFSGFTADSRVVFGTARWDLGGRAGRWNYFAQALPK